MVERPKCDVSLKWQVIQSKSLSDMRMVFMMDSLMLSSGFLGLHFGSRTFSPW